MMTHGDQVSFWGDRNVLKLYYRDGYTMRYLLKSIKLYIKTSEFMVCTLYFNKAVKIFWISKKKYLAKEKKK